MRLPDVAVEGFKIEVELAEIGWLKLLDLELEGHEADQPTVEEEQVHEEVPAADLEPVLFADECEVATEFQQELAQVRHQGPPQIAFRVGCG